MRCLRLNFLISLASCFQASPVQSESTAAQLRGSTAVGQSDAAPKQKPVKGNLRKKKKLFSVEFRASQFRLSRSRCPGSHTHSCKAMHRYALQSCPHLFLL